MREIAPSSVHETAQRAEATSVLRGSQTSVGDHKSAWRRVRVSTPLDVVHNIYFGKIF